MKLFLMILLFLGLGGWYCYDKYGDEIFGAGESISEKDPRVTALEGQALKLYPTKEKQRQRWLADQMAAMSKLTQRRKGVPTSMGDEIRALAAKKFPNNYDKQYEFVLSQETSALVIKRAINSFELSKEETAAVTDAVARIYAGDYSTQASSIMRLGEALSSVKEKWKDVPRGDYNAILKNTLKKMADDPDEAVRYFDRQFLARHNFLMKKYPPDFGDLRDGIQEMFPSDFCAQLDELNTRLDAALRKGKVVAQDPERKKLEDFFYKYVFIKEIDGQSYNTYFINVEGKKVVLFPVEMLEHINGEFSMDYGDIKFKTRDIYISENSMFAVAIPNCDIPVDGVEFEKPVNIPASFNGVRVVVMGANKNGSKRSVYPVLKNDTFSFGINDYSKVANFGSGGSLIIDIDTRKVLGLLQFSPTKGVEFFSGLNATYASTSQYQMPGCESIIKGIEDIVRQDVSWRASLAAIDTGNVKNWRKYNHEEYMKQLENVKKICAINYWLMRFVRTNTFEDTLKSEYLAPIAEKFKFDFTQGPRLSKSLFYSKYTSYLSSIREKALYDMQRMRKDLAGKAYYPFAQAVPYQFEICENTVEYLKGVVLFDSRAEPFTNVDLAIKFNKGSYAPKFVPDKETQNEISAL